ncbi:hypothetical protein HNR23_001861 [Nocardiopsis mwathae]|uniref:Uncharacterized protein n=1 Tax=Nocardiopsis mwathae TaxID=1472723 RepID=A0A7X0D5L6_9ACTN|nr:hypothetical protein [Nocardiopsis mwathae]MBB6171801.1 hypothetical protein [Nocardiopsis mwathae]
MFDPTLPPADRDLLAAHPEALIPAGRTPPPPLRPRWEFPDLPDRIPARLTVVAALFLVALMTRSGALILITGLGLVLVAINLAIAGLLSARRVAEPPARAAARAHHGRYLTSDDLDRPARALLTRAQAAVDAATSAPQAATGHADTIDNTVVLPEQLWDIATRLRHITDLRARARVAENIRLDIDVSGLLAERHAALRAADTAVTGRVQALERYAAHLTAAAEHHRRLQELQRLLDEQQDYRDLLAQNAADPHAVRPVEELTDRARAAEENLRRCLEEAAHAARMLDPGDAAPDEEEGPDPPRGTTA